MKQRGTEEELAVMSVLGHELGHLAAGCSAKPVARHELAADVVAGRLVLDFAQRECGGSEATPERTRQAVAVMEATIRALDWAAGRQGRKDEVHPPYAERVTSFRESCCISDECRAHSDTVQSELSDLLATRL